MSTSESKDESITEQRGDQEGPLLAKLSWECRRLLLTSIIGVVLACTFLGAAFKASETQSAAVLVSTCPGGSPDTCYSCIQQVSIVSATFTI